MQSIYALSKLVDQYASVIEKLNLSGEQLAEYGRILGRLQKQIETGELGSRVVNDCLASLARFAGQSLPKAS